MRLTRCFVLLLVAMVHLNSIAQNIGIGTSSPAARLDVLGSNNWDLSNTEGDMRVGNGSYRIKVGVALGGGGAGAAAIMQYGQPGGYNVLALGSQGNYLLQLNGTLNRVGLGTNLPDMDFEIRTASGSASPQLGITQMNTADSARIRMRNTSLAHWQMAAFIGASSTDDAFTISDSRTGAKLGLNGNAALLLNNSAGTDGQVLKSKGPGAAAEWSSATNVLYNTTKILVPTFNNQLAVGTGEAVLAGMQQMITVAGAAKLMLNFNLTPEITGCTGCGPTRVNLFFKYGSVYSPEFTFEIPEGQVKTISGSHLLEITGSANLELRIRLLSGPNLIFRTPANTSKINNMIYQLIPQ